MWKYYLFLFLILGIALFYVYIKDPCNQQLRTDFSDKYPSYKILNSSASEGSPESVRCHVSYQKPDSEQIHEETWLYKHTGRGWEFSRILAPSAAEQTGGAHDERPRNGDREASTGGAELLQHPDRVSQYASHTY